MSAGSPLVSAPRNTPARTSPVRTVALVLLVLALLAAGIRFMMTRGQAPNGQAAKAPAGNAPAGEGTPGEAPAVTPEVAVQPVAARVLAQPIRVSGTLKSDEVIALSSKAQGFVRELRVKEGDRVQRGQLLVRIDDTEIRAQRDRAQAALASAQAKLQQSIAQRGIKNAAAQSDYKRAQEQLENAKTKVSQAKSLAGISATETEQAAKSAAAALQSAKERLKALNEGSRKQERATAQLAVSRAETQAAKLKGILDRREQLIRDGAISREEVENARRDFEASQAEVNTARQQLDLVNEGPRQEDIRQGEEAVRQAEATLRTAEANRARRQVSDEDVTAAENQVRQAQTALDAAKAALAQSEVNDEEIRSSRAAINQARADIRFYDSQLADTRVYSPVNGIVSKRNAHVGENVSNMNSDLMTVVATDTVYFEATAPETTLPYLSVGGSAEVTLDALPGRNLTGVIRQIIPVTEGQDRSVRLRISIPRVSEAVVGGFARATIKGSSGDAKLAIPRTALITEDGLSKVYVYNGSKVQLRTIEAAVGAGDWVEVQKGLRVGERIVTEGKEALSDGAEVKLKSGETPAVTIEENATEGSAGGH